MATTTAASSASANSFQVIKEWQDLRRYAGQIVAVDSDYYFAKTYLGEPDSFHATHSSGGFLFSDIPFAFAHVSREPLKCFQGGIGYHLNTLLKPNERGGATIVNEQKLEGYGPLSVRMASSEELQKIRAVVLSSSAFFSTLFCEEATKETMNILMKV